MCPDQGQPLPRKMHFSFHMQLNTHRLLPEPLLSICSASLVPRPPPAHLYHPKLPLLLSIYHRQLFVNVLQVKIHHCSLSRLALSLGYKDLFFFDGGIQHLLNLGASLLSKHLQKAFKNEPVSGYGFPLFEQMHSDALCRCFVENPEPP